ncbi:MAG: hypothetical protein NTW54_11915 [Bacteroidetes bacterium]|nr:hypothetical protein [Bacteroidota bacterium]
MLRILFSLLLFIPGFCFSQTIPKLILRNVKAPVEVNGVIIKQDHHNIGFVKLLEPYNGGKPATVYQVCLPNGLVIATAFSFGKGSHEWMVTILDNPEITFKVSSKAGADVKDIALILIQNGYL